MAKVYEIAFQLAGKLGSNFHSTFLSANKSIANLDSQIKKLKADMKTSGADKNALNAQLSGLNTQREKLVSAQKAADNFKKSTTAAFKAAAVTATVATAAVTGYYATAMKLANGVMEQAKHARSAAAISGVSTRFYQQMAYAAGIAGVSTENFDKSLAKMAINLGEAKRGSKEMTQVFAELGISSTQLQNMKPEEAFSRIMHGLNGVTDAALRTDLARKVFGKIGTSMIPLANMSAAQIRELEREAKRLGFVIDQSAIDQAKAFQRAKAKFNAISKGTKLTLGMALMPGLAAGMESIGTLARQYQPAIKQFAKDFGQGISEATPEILKTVQAFGNLVGVAYRGVKAFSNLIGGFHNLVYICGAWVGLKVAVAFWSMGSAAIGAGSAMIGMLGHLRNLQIVTALVSGKIRLVAAATRIWAGVQALLNVVMSANPIGLVIIGAAALAAAAVWVYNNWDKVKAFFGDWSSVTDAISGFIDGIRERFAPLFDWISEKWTAIKNVFSATPAAGNEDGSADIPDLPGHALGGIFNREHIARFAERNKTEAAIPIDGSSRSVGLWQKTGQMLGVGGSRSGGSGGININQVFNISGGNRDEIAAGVGQANDALLKRLESLRSNEERLSYA